MAIRLDDGAGDRIAGTHDDGSATIDGAGTSAPVSVDGGLGSPELYEIMAAVGQTAHDLSIIHGVLGEQVREATSRITDTDEQVAEIFTGLTGDGS